MMNSNPDRWYLRERYAVLLVFAALAVAAALLGILARGDAGNKPEPKPTTSSSSSSATA